MLFHEYDGYAHERFVFYSYILTENGCDEKSSAGDGESLDQVDSSCSVVLSSQ